MYDRRGLIGRALYRREVAHVMTIAEIESPHLVAAPFQGLHDRPAQPAAMASDQYGHGF
jgi:hypothetical protein